MAHEEELHRAAMQPNPQDTPLGSPIRRPIRIGPAPVNQMEDTESQNMMAIDENLKIPPYCDKKEIYSILIKITIRIQQWRYKGLGLVDTGCTSSKLDSSIIPLEYTTPFDKPKYGR